MRDPIQKLGHGGCAREDLKSRTTRLLMKPDFARKIGRGSWHALSLALNGIPSFENPFRFHSQFDWMEKESTRGAEKLICAAWGGKRRTDSLPTKAGLMPKAPLQHFPASLIILFISCMR